MHRVLVICLSEATPTLVMQWAQAGLLPNLLRLMADGATGHTSYGIPYLLTPQLWTTATTGRTAGYHGIFDYWQRGSDGAFWETSGADVRAPTVWDHLSEHRRDSIVVNVPHTYPPRPVRGVVISGQDAPGLHSSIAHPPSILPEIARQFGPYLPKAVFPRGQTKAEYRHVLAKEVNRQTDVLEYLMRHKKWDFFMAYYSATAMAQHYFWSDLATPSEQIDQSNAVLISYIALDAAIGRLVNCAGQDAITFVISECGAGPLRSGIQMNTWLETEGLLAHRRGGAVKASPARASLGRLVSAAKPIAQRLLPDSLLVHLNRAPLRAWMHSAITSDVDWSRTRAYYRGKGEGNIYVNLRGREPRGLVAPGAEYEAVRDEAISALSALVDPISSEPAVEHIFKREELFQGPFVEMAPDLVVAWRNFAYMPTESDSGSSQLFVPRWREFMTWPTTGSHRMPGVFIASGPGIARNASFGEVRLIDLAPTWLGLLGVQVPDTLEGAEIGWRLRNMTLSEESRCGY